MRHVGEEVGFVLARLLQFSRLELNRGVCALQIVALCLQLLGLLLQLGIGLLQFDLLLFQPRLRLLQCPALFLQFLVRDAQFFALGLELFGLALGFFKQSLKVAAIICRTDRNADRRRRLIQKRDRAFIDLT